MKKKMDPLKKIKLIYSGELILIAVVALVIGILDLTYVIRINNTVLTIFNWVTMFGGLWIIIDFLWTLLSPKRRAKNALIDKIILLPLGTFLLTFDLIALIGNYSKDNQYDFYRIGVSVALLYLSFAYTFQGIYHWFHPLPSLLEELEKEEQEEPQEVNKVKEEDTQKDDNKEA